MRPAGSAIFFGENLEDLKHHLLDCYEIEGPRFSPSNSQRQVCDLIEARSAIYSEGAPAIVSKEKIITKKS